MLMVFGGAGDKKGNKRNIPLVNFFSLPVYPGTLLCTCGSDLNVSLDGQQTFIKRTAYIWSRLVHARIGNGDASFPVDLCPSKLGKIATITVGSLGLLKGG
jgi:hypothetical protein